ncbi:MAG: L-glyceraldehyde 3-phosphate reductase [Saprospiraceae bacterium]|nr:L-glyceraldehyde 3-phosphate reductase [Saprospiraceae bacterium]MBK8281365.1 L-glyceraldehyde 3-phosphate reductase [Saprospiraceae bacterium]MBK8514330.1 L-glyceraldehyde 3-phosphate reductase [Saprospiraceae bacterium]MBL0112380.1 L-glyceraldehyde 3-phosphate reductase [Saprospiraceae bacterium]MBP7921219.1 L-glyceraldehyde 3-phosphate reductase [Saprospiraceae bacterium]
MKINDKFDPGHYRANADRYDQMEYRRCGLSGILLPVISIGLWHNFGHTDDLENGRNILRTAFDHGITHFDLANNYGPPFGAAEENFGKLYKQDWKLYRDQLIISSKAGWDMWPGPYGNLGSRKYLIASCDQSLKRMKLDYVDIFYSHRRDPDTPLEETMGALDQIVRSGKALYAGISQYTATDTAKAYDILKSMGTPLLIHQPRYSMMDRWVETGLLDILGKKGIGSIAFSPLEQGILTDKYLKGIPKDSRIGRDGRYLTKDRITPTLIEKVSKLQDIAKSRDQSLAQMAVAWLLKDPRITSVLVGASSPAQLIDSIGSIKNLTFNKTELKNIETILSNKPKK